MIKYFEFENEIEEVKYDQLTTDEFTPIIPEPIKLISNKDFVEIAPKLKWIQILSAGDNHLLTVSNTHLTLPTKPKL